MSLGTPVRGYSFSWMPGETAPEYESPASKAESRPESGAELNANRARQAVPVGRMRYVLAISLFLVVVCFVLLYFLLRP